MALARAQLFNNADLDAFLHENPKNIQKFLANFELKFGYKTVVRIAEEILKFWIMARLSKDIYDDNEFKIMEILLRYIEQHNYHYYAPTEDNLPSPFSIPTKKITPFINTLIDDSASSSLIISDTPYYMDSRPSKSSKPYQMETLHMIYQNQYKYIDIDPLWLER